VGMVEHLKYANLKDRGYMMLTFTPEEVRSDWHYVDSILTKDFNLASDRSYSAVTKIGEPSITAV
jgi:alkaline phosphatase D